MNVQKPDSSIRSFGANIQLRQLEAMQAEALGVIQGADLEYIHRMRVASRRLRAAQVLFDSFLFKRRSREWEKAIKRVTRSLGQARDLDIQLGTIQRFRLMVMDPRCQLGAGRLYLRLLQARASAQKQVDTSVQRFSGESVVRYAQARLQATLQEVPPEGEPSTALYVLADKSIRRRLEDLLAYEPFVTQPEKKEELHAMRIAAKRLRYTLEIFEPIYPGGLKLWLKPLKEIQDVMGLIHDCDVWAQYLPVFVEDERNLTEAYFGHLRGFRRILPGIEVFSQNRASERNRLYAEYVETWNNICKKHSWEKLRELTIGSIPVLPRADSGTQGNLLPEDASLADAQETGPESERAIQKSFPLAADPAEEGSVEESDGD